MNFHLHIAMDWTPFSRGQPAMKRPESRKGLKRPATAAESQPVLEEPPAPSAGSAEAVPGHRAEAPDAPQFDHYGCSKCKKKPHGCTRCKTFANDNRSGYFWLGSQVVRKIPGTDLD